MSPEPSNPEPSNPEPSEVEHQQQHEHHEHEHHEHEVADTSTTSARAQSTWDERYREQQWPAQPDAALQELVGSLAPGSALDLGCGPGRNAVWLARQGWSVTGVDASSVGLEQAAARARASGVTLQLVNADLRHYHPPEATFDLVVVANMHFDPEERSAFFGRAAAALVPGGHIFIIGHHLDSLGRAGPPFAERLYTEALLADLLPTLTVERIQRAERVTVAGEPPIVDAIAWATAPKLPTAPKPPTTAGERSP
jgi:2-polyprenyl-3-methyl-5-hydroxy-6-metoxy-1,4-benzoquinol methylase